MNNVLEYLEDSSKLTRQVPYLASMSRPGEIIIWTPTERHEHLTPAPLITTLSLRYHPPLLIFDQTRMKSPASTNRCPSHGGLQQEAQEGVCNLHRRRHWGGGEGGGLLIVSSQQRVLTQGNHLK